VGGCGLVVNVQVGPPLRRGVREVQRHIHLAERAAIETIWTAIPSRVARPCRALRPPWAALDSAGAAAAGAAAAGVLNGALGTGAARLQSVVPLVRRSVDKRSSVGCDCALKEPGSAARRRHCGQILCHRTEPAAGAWALSEE
jgi:hypothetical protein